MVEPLFQTQITCAFCGGMFKTSRVRPSFKKSILTESDFYKHYKEVNPDYYVVRVCPICGFSSTEHFAEKFTAEQKGRFEQKVATNWNGRDYGGERSWDDALQTFKLALVCAQLKEESERVTAGILHHIAWLYRSRGETEQEKRFLRFALDSYVKVYEVEGIDGNNARLMYLMGELNRRLGNYLEAVRWFGRVIQDKQIVDAAMIRACREQWVATREDMLAAQMELPEEMA